MDLESFIIQQYTEPAFPSTNTLISPPGTSWKSNVEPWGCDW